MVSVFEIQHAVWSYNPVTLQRLSCQLDSQIQVPPISQNWSSICASWWACNMFWYQLHYSYLCHLTASCCNAVSDRLQIKYFKTVSPLMPSLILVKPMAQLQCFKIMSFYLQDRTAVRALTGPTACMAFNSQGGFIPKVLKHLDLLLIPPPSPPVFFNTL